MPDYFQIVYVRMVLQQPSTVKEKFEGIRDWTWGKSPFVRWTELSVTTVEQVKAKTALLATAGLVVLDWPAKEAPPLAESILNELRAIRPDLKVLAVKRDGASDPRWDSHFAGGESLLNQKPDPHLHGVPGQEMGPKEIEAALNRLHIVFPFKEIHLELNPQHFPIGELLDWMGEGSLKLTIQKFFPEADELSLRPVGGGWSGTKLCRISVDNDAQPYFLKFFTDYNEYKDELRQHQNAKTWLGSALVDLKLVPDISERVEDQWQAFPETTPPIYPVCYKAAFSHGRPRETLKKIYQIDPRDGFVKAAFGRLIDILRTGQDIPIQPDEEHPEPPWVYSGHKDDFFLTRKQKQEISAAIHDLARYGSAMCHSIGIPDWEHCYAVIEKLLYQELPSWLDERIPVVRGHIHGDPNPRNCLVHPEVESDVLLIDCGGYRAKGRLVSDLAIIERDVKLVLLETDPGAGGYFDLDVQHLSEWCRAEHSSISKGIDYAPGDAPHEPIQRRTPKTRAYELVGLVRQRAKELSQPKWDKQGRHYFAALLYRTLDSLKHKEIQATKKLFALYSASEILRAPFD